MKKSHFLLFMVGTLMCLHTENAQSLREAESPEGCYDGHIITCTPMPSPTEGNLACTIDRSRNCRVDEGTATPAKMRT